MLSHAMLLIVEPPHVLIHVLELALCGFTDGKCVLNIVLTIVHCESEMLKP